MLPFISKCGQISRTDFRIPFSKSHIKNLADSVFFSSFRHCKTRPKNIKYVAKVLSGRYPKATGTQMPFETSAAIIITCDHSALNAILNVPSQLTVLALAIVPKDLSDEINMILPSFPVCLFIYVSCFLIKFSFLSIFLNHSW